MASDLSNLTGTVRVVINASATKSGDLADATENLAYTASNTLAFGSTTTLVDQIYNDEITVAKGGTATLDLYGGLVNKFGSTINLATLKCIMLNNLSFSSCPLTISGNGCGWMGSGDVETLPQNACTTHTHLVGWAVTDTSADTITLTNLNASDPATVDVVIIGTSA